MLNQVPTFTHDCDCRFLGTFNIEGTTVDTYCCDRFSEVVVRFGDDGSEYYALPLWSVPIRIVSQSSSILDKAYALCKYRMVQ